MHDPQWLKWVMGYDEKGSSACFQRVILKGRVVLLLKRSESTRS
jgi:hypothetical protein